MLLEPDRSAEGAVPDSRRLGVASVLADRLAGLPVPDGAPELQARPKTGGEEDAQGSLAVLDLALLDQPKGGRERHRLDRQELVGLMSGLATLQPGSHIDVDPLI